MLPIIYPSKFQPGDTIRVIAPASLFQLSPEKLESISHRLEGELGFKLSLSRGCSLQPDLLGSTPVEARVNDLHDAFADTTVAGILTFIGGFNSNELLPYLDWDLIRQNPKVLCGFSDITALSNAIFARTGLVTYSGPHYSTFGQLRHFDYILDHFRRCLMQNEPIDLLPPSHWSDDEWYNDQEKRDLLPHPGWRTHNAGAADGHIIGGNLCTLNLLQGTPYMPPLEGAILFLEDDYESHTRTFNRDLESLTQLPAFEGVRGLLIGRFQKATGMTNDILDEIVRRKSKLRNIPVVSGLDFGHTDPKFTFPIGGQAKLEADHGHASLTLTHH
jgi:muramoyltetrapeptide carboxypeptidase